MIEDKSKTLSRIDIDLLCAETARFLQARGTIVSSWATRMLNGGEEVGYILPDAASPGEALALEGEPVTVVMAHILGEPVGKATESLSVGAVLRVIALSLVSRGLYHRLPLPLNVSIDYRGGRSQTKMRLLGKRPYVVAAA